MNNFDIIGIFYIEVIDMKKFFISFVLIISLLFNVFADNKQDFLKQIQSFCQKECDKPIIFEVKTIVEDEQDGLNLLKTYNRDKLEEGLIKCYKAFVK